MKYKKRIETMIEQLKNTSTIKMIDYQINPPADEDLFTSIEKQMDIVIPESLTAFYREVNGFSLEWEHQIQLIRNDDDSDKGFIRILPVEKVFKSWKDNVWFDDFEGGDCFKDVYPLDYFIPEACAAIIRNGREFKGTIHYHYFGEELFDTGLSFDEYFERLLMSRGFWYFIKALCPDTQDSWEAEMFLKNAQKIFKDFNSSLFKIKKTTS